MNKCIQPGVLSGQVTPPPSKSYAHRAILCAALANGESVIENLVLSDDIAATLSAVKTLGAQYTIGENSVVIAGIGSFANKAVIDCNESGSLLRFMIPICLAFGGTFRFIGRGKLGTRPLDVFEECFHRDGIIYKNESTDTALDCTVSGVLKGGEYSLDGGVSSQFITGFLYAMACCDAPCVLHITGTPVSIGYIDITLDALRAFGIQIEHKDYKTFFLKGSRSFTPCTYQVEADYSQAAFFAVANFLGNHIQINGMKYHSLQGDRVILDFLRILSSSEAAELVFDAENCPDIIPIFSVACALRRGKTIIKNAGRLRIKECDRLHAVCEELNKLGACVTEGRTSLQFEGVPSFTGGTVFSHHDHRIAMSLAIAATRCREPVYIQSAECVKKSYPTFFQDFMMLGGNVS